MTTREQLLSDLLMDRGLWPDFVQYRETLLAKGVKKRMAHRKALDRYLPREAKMETSELPGAAEAELKQRARTKGDTDEEARLREEVARKEAVFDPLTDLVDAGMFGKEDFTLDSVKWVLSNLYTKVDPQDAPNALAWSTLQHFRAVPSDAGKALVQFLGKFVPARVEEDKPDDGPIDGAAQLRLISRIRKFGEKLQGGAEAARRVHNPKVTGSTPVPATIEA